MFKNGDEVRFVCAENHEAFPEWYPAVGTVGTVLRPNEFGNYFEVQWPEGSTSKNDRWWVGKSRLEAVE